MRLSLKTKFTLATSLLVLAVVAVVSSLYLGRLMRQTLARQGASPTLTFLDETERFLLEVANAPDSVSPREVRELQQRISSGSLLFKVRIIESNLRTQGQKL